MSSCSIDSNIEPEQTLYDTCHGQICDDVIAENSSNGIRYRSQPSMVEMRLTIVVTMTYVGYGRVGVGLVEWVLVHKSYSTYHASTFCFFCWPFPYPTTCFKLPKVCTSLILVAPDIIMHNLSMPQPQPPVGGRPHVSAFK